MRHLITVFAFAGIVVSALALQVHYSTGTEPCSINERWDCGIVNHSSFAVIEHIPVAAIGIAGYLLLALLALVRRRGLLFVATLLGLGFALYLSHIEKDILQVWCLYCVISQGIIALLTLLSLGWLVSDGDGQDAREKARLSSGRRTPSDPVRSALIKLNYIDDQRMVRALDVRVGNAADHARRKPRGAPAGVGFRVDRTLS